MKPGANISLDTTTFRVTTYTSDIRGAGTDANVFINIRGKDARGRELETGKMTLDNSANNFERNRADTFLLKKAKNVGEVTGITVGHDNRGLGAAWHLDHVEVVDEGNGKQYYFDCRMWFDKKHGGEGDCACRFRLPCAHITSREAPSLPVCRRRQGGAGPRARGARGCLRGGGLQGDGADQRPQGCRHRRGRPHRDVRAGRQGRFGQLRAAQARLEQDDFERGRTDVFTVMSKPLGKIESIWIGHNNRGFNPGWHLHSVEVMSVATGERVSFLADQWLDKSAPPFSTECTLFPEGSEQAKVTLRCAAPPVADHQEVVTHGFPDRLEALAVPQIGLLKYKLIVHTSDIRGAGTDAEVSAVIEGDKVREDLG